MSFSCLPVYFYVCVDVCACGNVQFICLYVLNHMTVYTHPHIQYINTELKNKDKVIKNRIGRCPELLDLL